MVVLITVVAFLRQIDLSGQIWIAPAIAYLAIFLGAFLAWLGIQRQAYFTNTIPQQPIPGSLLLAAMLTKKLQNYPFFFPHSRWR